MNGLGAALITTRARQIQKSCKALISHALPANFFSWRAHFVCQQLPQWKQTGQTLFCCSLTFTLLIFCTFRTYSIIFDYFWLVLKVCFSPAFDIHFRAHRFSCSCSISLSAQSVILGQGNSISFPVALVVCVVLPLSMYTPARPCGSRHSRFLPRRTV
jgi:hypothetical protein